MLKIPTDFKEFIALLNAHEVRYLVIGGYAVAYHGHPRMTGDIDILIEVSGDNASRLVAALSAFGFASMGLKPEDFLASGTIVQLGYPPLRIDLLTSVAGTNFNDAWAGREEPVVDGVVIAFIGRAALLASKAAAGRTKDLSDLEQLG